MNSVGVLALQGSWAAHARALERLGADVRLVRTPADLEAVDALVIPGGESTVIRDLCADTGLAERIRALARSGVPVLGTCAGAILMAREIRGASEAGLGLVDVVIARNAYGRQRESFAAPVDVAGPPFEGVFIRAPAIVAVAPSVEVLGRLRGRPVWVRQGSSFACTFHPELTADDRVHACLLRTILVARCPPPSPPPIPDPPRSGGSGATPSRSV